MKKAFTLVELLVAVLLLTLLIGTALFSYKQILLNIAKAEKSTFYEVLKVHQIRTSIESMQPYVVDDYNQFNNPMKKLHVFFSGDKKHFQYISQNPTFSNTPSLSSFECREEDLLFKEEPLYGSMNLNEPSFSEKYHTEIYWHNLQSCEFEYVLNHKTLLALKNRLPNILKINFVDADEKKHTIVTTIKSDYNITSSEIYELLYAD